MNSADSRIQELFSIKEWRQRITLPGNVVTPGTRSEYEWDFCHLPADLSGKTFLDVGANDGMFSFIAEKKGAKQVVATDIYTDHSQDLNMQNGWSAERITRIKAIKNSSIEIIPCSIYGLSEKLGNKFDYVFCGNVIAWLESPVAAIKQLSSVCSGTLIIREDISRVKAKPVLEYVNNQDLSGCYFMGNRLFYENLLSSLGFREIRFQQVDTFAIFEKRSSQFKKFIVEKGTRYFTHPFENASSGVSEKRIEEVISSVVNGRAFINRLGWVNPADLQQLPEALPVNPLKRNLFMRKWKAENPDNYTITAKR